MADRKVGDIKTSGGIVTTVTAIDPETNSVAWDVDYSADYKKLFNVKSGAGSPIERFTMLFTFL